MTTYYGGVGIYSSLEEQDSLSLHNCMYCGKSNWGNELCVCFPNDPVWLTFEDIMVDKRTVRTYSNGTESWTIMI